MAEREPEQVAEPVELVARNAAIDVAKDSGWSAPGWPHPSKADRRAQQVWSVPARFTAVTELAEPASVQRIERVVLESTSDRGAAGTRSPHDA